MERGQRGEKVFGEETWGAQGHKGMSSLVLPKKKELEFACIQLNPN